MFDETCNHGADMQVAMQLCHDVFVHGAEIKKPARRPAFYMRLITEICQPYFFSGAAGATGAAGAAGAAAPGAAASAGLAASAAGAAGAAIGAGAGAAAFCSFFSQAVTAVMANSAASRIEYFFI
jgi:hypothetical protein